MTDPIAYTATRYRCPHCRKSWSNRANALKHLPLCFSDPARRTCKTCQHDSFDYEEYGRICAIGERQGWSCGHCGRHPDDPACDGHWPKPLVVAKQLRVLCPSWEARS